MEGKERGESKDCGRKGVVSGDSLYKVSFENIVDVQSLGMCAVVGTLGYLSLSETSLALRFLFSPEAFASPLFDSVDGCTDCLTGGSSDPLSREGFDEEYLRR